MDEEVVAPGDDEHPVAKCFEFSREVGRRLTIKEALGLARIPETASV